ncbi:hypothetical protein ANCDUO_11520 [Ancylostoma duodenale]|uniref:Uncharacterized protein n=1 Tax=Ancylostoma duodenale TaxID=51022 RepID=A0A0C2CNI9_9BILA|nr:hypothetical protein ANCDUO_11520 [Ancylostoma duodenale]
MHLTRVVLALGRWIKYDFPLPTEFFLANELKIPNAWQKLFDLAIQGVEQRLANPDAIIRQSGMFVGETFSIWMGGERLEFEYQNDNWLDEMQGIRDGKADEDKNPITMTQLEPVLDAVDMQMPTSSSSVVDSQPVDSDDEEDFKAYDVPESERSVETLAADAEPERTAPAPNYIRDCMEQLAEKEKYEVFVEFFGSVVRGWIEWALSSADDVHAAEQQRNLARNVASVLLQKMEGPAAIEESSSTPRLL